MYAWHIAQVIEVDRIKVRFTGNNGKHRNRHFLCPMSSLLSGLDIPPPRPSLNSTCSFFMKLLSPKDYQRLQSTALELDGVTVRLGTACSGSDICVVAVQSVLRMLNHEFDVPRFVFRKLCIYIYICFAQ